MRNYFQYFIGIGLPRKESLLFSAIKQEIHPKGSLSSPAHLTLVPPFFWQNENDLVQRLESWSSKQKTFRAKFEKVQSFKQPKYATIFLAPEKSGDFKKLYLSIHNKLGFDHTGSFVAHLTLGQRIPYEIFDETKNKIKNMKLYLELEVKTVNLYRKEANSKIWETYRFFTFPG